MAKDSVTAASEIFEQFRDLLSGEFAAAQAIDVRAGIIQWLEARIDSYRDRSAEEQQRLVEVHLPEEIRENFGGVGQKDRFNLAVTAFDRWRVQVLDRRVYDRALAFLENRGDLQELKADGVADLQELQAIESRFLKDFPEIHKSMQRIISESKLDCFYVTRERGFVSRRLGRQIQRMKTRES